MTRKASRKPLELYLTECGEPLGNWPSIDTVRRHDGHRKWQKTGEKRAGSILGEKLNDAPGQHCAKGLNPALR
ncbi:hypothetical protein [Croceicoccus sp. Ery15]|uniref:hypothetical protein n=1 Tax=Croceicoccus sp. Ery15 TaxID=1703338 RepID=UPI001E5758A2|nr:hypothetical protein [Croceicoccus sp. Ery15]